MGYMAIRLMTQHGWVAEAQRIWRTLAIGDEPQTYQMAFLAKGGPQSCLVKGCPGRSATRTAMWVLTPRVERALDSFQHRVM